MVSQTARDEAHARVAYLLHVNGINPMRVLREGVDHVGYGYIDEPVKWKYARGGWSLGAKHVKWHTPPGTTDLILAAIFHLNRLEGRR